MFDLFWPWQLGTTAGLEREGGRQDNQANHCSISEGAFWNLDDTGSNAINPVKTKGAPICSFDRALLMITYHCLSLLDTHTLITRGGRHGAA